MLFVIGDHSVAQCGSLGWKAVIVELFTLCLLYGIERVTHDVSVATGRRDRHGRQTAKIRIGDTQYHPMVTYIHKYINVHSDNLYTCATQGRAHFRRNVPVLRWKLRLGWLIMVDQVIWSKPSVDRTQGVIQMSKCLKRSSQPMLHVVDCSVDSNLSFEPNMNINISNAH